MSRPASQSAGQRRLLPGAILLMIVLSFLPVRFGEWVDWFGDLTLRIISPISHPIAQVSRRVTTADPEAGDPRRVRELREERDRMQLLYRQAMEENRRLRDLIDELEGGLAIDPSLRIRQLAAPVVGTSSDLTTTTLRVRAGREQGVELNTVAVVRGVQLVGRVENTSARLCQVRPLTDRRGDSVRGRVIFREDGAGPTAELRPTGRGTLRGPVAGWQNDDRLGGYELERGMIVRLDDDTWPRHAQMLVLGEVERVEQSEDSALRYIVTVRPTVQLERVSEVVLRIAEDSEADGR